MQTFASIRKWNLCSWTAHFVVS